MPFLNSSLVLILVANYMMDNDFSDHLSLAGLSLHSPRAKMLRMMRTKSPNLPAEAVRASRAPVEWDLLSSSLLLL
jgi:hypothetical protein